MKRTMIILAAFVAALASCSKSEIAPEGVTETMTLTFTGSTAGTKVALGDKDGNSKYHLLWEEGDAIGVYTSEGTYLGAATLTDGAGEASGTFVLDGATVTGGSQVYVTYPSDYDGTVAADQTLSSASSATVQVGAKSADITVVDGETLAFTLTPGTATVKVNVSSSDFSGMYLSSVMIYSPGAALATGSDYVELSYDTPTALSSAQSVVLTTLPVETATDFYVVATMTDDSKTVTIPVLFEGKTLPSSAVSVIPMTGLSLASNSCAWYEPTETRALVGGGWAYGPANTTMGAIPSTTSTYNEYTVDVKARGRFNKVEEPKYAKVLLSFDMNNSSNPYTRVGHGSEASSTDMYTLTSEDAYAVPVVAYKNGGSYEGGMGKWAIYGEDGETVLWAFNFWMTDTPDEIAVTGGTIQDRNLGAGYAGNYGKWWQNGCYFQWGRPYAFGWANATYTISDTQATNSLEYAIQHPAYMLNAYGVDTSGNRDWNVDDPNRYLWQSDKTIYDPCPKGYKVATKTITDALKSAVYDGSATVSSTTAYYIQYGESYWPVAGGFNAGATAKLSRGSSNAVRFAWYWSCEGTSTAAYCVYFDYNSLSGYTDGTKTMDNTRPRSCAYSVRCMVDDNNR